MRNYLIFLKGMLAGILALLPIISLAQDNNSKGYIPGDVNGDGVVTIADVVAMCNYALESHSGSLYNSAADIDGNGEITVADIVLVVNNILSSEQIIYTEPTTLYVNLGVEAATYTFDAGTADFTVKGFEIGGWAKSFDKEKFNAGESLEYDTHYYDGNQKVEYTFLKIRKDGRYIKFDFSDFLGWEDLRPSAGRQIYMLVNIKGVNVKLYVGQFSSHPDNFDPNPSKVEMGAEGGVAKVTFKNIVDVEALIFDGSYFWNTDNHPDDDEILVFSKGWVTVKRNKTEIEFTLAPNTTGKDREFQVLLSWGDDNITYSGIQYGK